MADSNQYTNSKVQPEDFTSGWMIALIIAGLGVSLPILYLGAEIGLNLGFQESILVFCVSTLVLTVLCVATTIIGNRSRLSSYMILRFSFGSQGAKIINFIIGISLLGWFSVALELLAQAIQDTAIVKMGVHFPLWSIIVVGSIFITVTTIYGIKTLEKLANIAVPILSAFLIYVLYLSFSQDGNTVENLTTFTPESGSMTVFEATSTLIGASILVPVLMADFSRYIYNDRQSLISVLGLAIGTPFVMIISMIIAIQTGEVDIIQIMKSFDLVIPAFILIFVSTWVTNATNLYSVSLTFSTIIDDLGYTKWCLIASAVGTTMALLGFSNSFIEFLNILGIFSPSIAAIYILDFLLGEKAKL
jgi:cytosine permease